MPIPDTTAAAISLIGVVVEFGGALMLVALFSVLRRYVLRRPYFSAWTLAWAAIAVAIVSLAVRYNFPGLAAALRNEQKAQTRSFYFVYQTCKLLAFYSFVAGTRMYVAGNRRAIRLHGEWLLAPALAFLTVAFSPRGLNQVVMWQAPIAALAFWFCALALVRLPRSRRTLGTVATASGFALLGTLWVLYAVSFPSSHGNPPQGPWLGTMIVRYNTYLDLLLNVFLGYGMVVMLMEDAKREADDARAELRVAHDRMRRAALYDSLTESLNRRAFVEGVGLEMARATFGTVVIADVDDLKGVNDRYGHAAGDRILRHCADALREGLRPYDKLYRWGGDEFLVIVPSARALDVKQRLAETLSHAQPAIVNGDQVEVHVSIGAADYTGAEALEAAIESADRAMYDEKNGRKRRNSSQVIMPPENPLADLSRPSIKS